MSLLKIADAARLLNVETTTVYAYIARGMPHIRLSPRCIRFEEQDLKAWVEQCRSTRTSAAAGTSPLCKGEGEFIALLRKAPAKAPRKNSKPRSGKPRFELIDSDKSPTTL